jgi:ATP-dependent RNA helicase RhlB
MDFNELKLESRLLHGIADRGYKEMTAVQEQTLANTLQGLDVAVQSQTGTGKTAAFLITLFEHMLYNSGPKRKKALIIVPTRELAVQIEKEARLLKRLGYSHRHARKVTGSKRKRPFKAERYRNPGHR